MVFIIKAIKDIAKSIGCSVGVAVYYTDKAAMKIKNSGQKKKLEPMVKEIMSKFFSDVVLDKARLRLDSTLLTIGSFDAMTLGHTIYWRSPSFDPCVWEDMTLLMHELVHVRQIENDREVIFACKYGNGVLSTQSYESVPYEREAEAFKDKKKGEMYDMMVAHPLCIKKIEEEQRRLTSSDDWDWLVWG